MSKLILASQSKARQEMLHAAGFEFDAMAANVDERAIEKELLETEENPEKIAKALAFNKALSVPNNDVNNYTIGSDQILVFDGKIISKAKSKSEAKERLKEFRGKTHMLISAVCVSQHAELRFEDVQTATLTMRDFDDDFLARYIESAGDALTHCVGCYALEDIGVQLFEKIEGDYFTILGMPLLSLTSYLQQEGFGL